MALLDYPAPRPPSVDKVAILRQHILFCDLDPEFCAQIAAFTKIKEFKRDATIFAKGDPGYCLFAIVRGRVLVTTSSSEGKCAVLNQFEAGEIFGEIALLDGRMRTGDATALCDCTLLALERRDFIPVLEKKPEIALKLLEIMSGRLRRTTEQVEELLFLDLRGRLAKTLLRLTGGQPGGSIELSQSELSQRIGMSREMINRQLQVWARESVIVLARRRLTVLCPETLEEIATR
ncbi:MAG: Crp/Fnr family transcriptional regulator [Rhodoblastus sp.]